MAVSLDQFLDRLDSSGILSRAAAQALVDALSPDERPADGERLARWLVKQKKLTAYQAQQVYAGKGKSLVLGNYAVLDKLGEGGMGMVLKAEHRRMERVVALKVLSPKVTNSPDAGKRFQREVKAAAKLDHPNIVAAYDADEAGGTHFLVMQYVEGQDLSSLVRSKGPLPVDEAVNCILQAARGLEYAHQRGVIHRDIKPSNLLLARGGMVKILDMGLARIEGEVGVQADLTSTGAVMGTVDYMAPEQALSTKHADARSDVYSLGMTLWYLLAGKPAYDGDTLMARLLAHREAPIPSLSSVRGDVSATLTQVFERMVAKRPEDRYQSMGEVVAALSACLQVNVSVSPGAARGPSEDSRLGEFLAQSGGDARTRTATANNVAVAAPVREQAEFAATVTASGPEMPTDPQTLTHLVTAASGKGRGATSRVRSTGAWWQRRSVQIAGGSAGLLLIVVAICFAVSGRPDEPRSAEDRQLAAATTREDDSSAVPADASVPAIAVMVRPVARGGFEIVAPNYRADVAATGLIEKLQSGGQTLIEATEFGGMGRPEGGPVTATQAGSTLTFEQGPDYRLTYAFDPDGYIIQGRVGQTAAERDGIDGKSGYLNYISRFSQDARRVRPLDGLPPFDLPAGSEMYTSRFVVDFQGGAQVEVHTTQAVHSGFHFPGGPMAWGRTNMLNADNEIRFDIRPPASTAIPGDNFVLQFDGIGHRVEVPSLTWDGTTPLTIEAWIQSPFENQYPMTVMYLGGKTAWHLRTDKTADGEKSWASDLSGDSQATYIYYDQPITLKNQPIHIAAVLDDTMHRVFQNGRLLREKPHEHSWTTSGQERGLSLGMTRFQDSWRYQFSGWMDEVRISRSARYKADFNPDRRFVDDAETLALYHCDAGTGNILRDDSGNGHDGTIVGATWVTRASITSETSATAAQLDGTWQFVRGEMNGEPFSGETIENRTLVFRDGRYTLTFGGKTIEGTYAINATQSPGMIEFVALQGGSETWRGKAQSGIYELTGSTLRFCIAAPDRPSATSFESDASTSGQSVQTYVRADAQTTTAEVTVPPTALAFNNAGADSPRVELPTGFDGTRPCTIEVVLTPRSVARAGMNRPVFRSSGNLKLKQYEDGWQFVVEPRAATCVADHAVFPGQRTHLSAVSTGQEIRLFVNGRLSQSVPLSQAVPAGNGTAVVAGSVDDPAWEGLDAVIEQVRLSTTARYAADYQPPARMAADADTWLLYNCDEGQGTTLRDASGNGRDGTVVEAQWVSSGGPGLSVGDPSGTALDFAADVPEGSARVELPFGYPDDYRLTVEMYATIRSVPSAGTNRGIIFSNQLQLKQTARGLVLVHVLPDKSVDQIVHDGVAVGRRVNLTAACDGAELRLFVDGKRVGRTPLRPETQPQSTIVVGSLFVDDARWSPFDGTIDELRISNVPRYVGDFTPPPGYEPDGDTMALYRFDEGRGTVLRDASRNGRHGTIIGAEWVTTIPLTRSN